jgi:hypothetical protein
MNLIDLLVALGLAPDWYHRFLATHYFEPFIRKETNIIVITPPGVGKTQMVILAIVLIFIKDPSSHVIVLSNSDTLANVIARNVLMFLQSEVVQAIRPISFVKCTESEFTIEGNDGRPSLISAGTKSVLVGARCNYLIVDDGVKDQAQALGPEMEKLWSNYTQVAETRIVHGGVVCHVGTRWAITDLIGRCISRGMSSKWARQFSVINLALRNPKGEESYEFDTTENQTN